MRASDRVGQRYERLVITGVYRENKRTWAIVDCDCGMKGKHTRVDGIVSGATLSCGCYIKENNGRVTHGRYRDRIYNIWGGMVSRTTNSNTSGYGSYGGAGKGVSDEWRSFEVFLADMGEIPSSKHTLDRIDNTLGYSVGNCRWAISSVQLKNQDKRNKSTSTSQYKGVGYDSRYNGCWMWSVTQDYKTVRGYTNKDELLGAKYFNFCTKALYGKNVTLNPVDDLSITISQADMLHRRLVKAFGELY